MSTENDRCEEIATIGGRKQLFVDDYIVAQKSNVARKLGEISRENGARPVMVPNEREDVLYFGVYSTVLHDGDRFKMWYLATNRPDYDIGYAESRDGIHWERPDVGEDGRGNFVFQGHGFSCFIDADEDDADHRFKAAYGPAGNFVKEQKAIHLAHSPDGIHWTPYNGGRAVLPRTWFPHPHIEGRKYVTAADTHNYMIRDGEAGLYRIFTRDIYEGPQEGDEKKISRGSRSMSNPDVKADPTGWTMQRSWEFDREGPEEYRKRQIYALTNWIYEGVHFALMSVLKSPGGLIDFYLGTSRDAHSWDLTWVYAGQPLIPPGQPGSFDAAGAFPFSQVVTWKNRHWLYYGAMDKGHKDLENYMSIGLATLRLDGFVSLEAGSEPGEVATRPFKLQGRGLELNVDASRGRVLVEILDEVGGPIAGFTQEEFQDIGGRDELRLQPRWSERADLASLNGKIIRLKFIMQDARLHAFKVNSHN